MRQLLCNLGLQFADPAEERAFYEAFLARRLAFSRLMLALAGALMLVFIAWDRIIDPVGVRTTMWIRIGVVMPVCFACAAVLHWPWARRQFEPLIVTAGSMSALCISAICAILDGGYNLVAAGLLLVILFVASLFRMRTPAFALFSLFTVIGYFAALPWAHGYAAGMPAMNMLMVGTALALGTMAAISRELGAREEFLAQAEIVRSHARIEELLHSMLPAAIVRRIQGGETLIADQHDEVSIVFSDLVGFTQLSRQLDATTMVGMLNQLFSAFDRAAEEHGMHKIKTIGDAYMAVGGLIGEGSKAGPVQDAVGFAFALLRATRALATSLDVALDVRIGLHVGAVVAGVIGTSRPAFDCWGEAVNLASRLESNAAPGGVLLSENAWRLLRYRYDTEVRDDVQLKGIGGARVYLLRPPNEDPDDTGVPGSAGLPAVAAFL